MVERNEIQLSEETTELSEPNRRDPNEIAGLVMAAAAKARIESMMVIAREKPRDMDVVSQRLMKACERPGFAGIANENVYGAAWYRIPRGYDDFVQGFSVRFAEEAMRCMGNLEPYTNVIFDDQLIRIIEVGVIDLESNIKVSSQAVIEKTVERKRLKTGEIAISTRVNSYGKLVYVREATEDELRPKQKAIESKEKRNHILSLLPGDIQAQCRERILAIRAGQTPKDPDAQRRRIIDSFANVGVSAENLVEFVGHPLGGCSPPELQMLRDLFAAIRSGKTTFWAELAEVRADRESDNDEEKNEQSRVDAMKERLSKYHKTTTERNEEEDESQKSEN